MHPHVGPQYVWCLAAWRNQENTHPEYITALFLDQAEAEAACAPWLRVLWYASRAVQFHPHGGQSDFVWLSARTPHAGPQYVW